MNFKRVTFEFKRYLIAIPVIVSASGSVTGTVAPSVSNPFVVTTGSAIRFRNGLALSVVVADGFLSA